MANLTADCDSTASWPDDLTDSWRNGPGHSAGPGSTLSIQQPYVIGAILVLGGALLIALGVALIKRSSEREKLYRAPHLRRAYPLQWMWWIGVALFGIGHMCTFASLALAARSLMALFGQ